MKSSAQVIRVSFLQIRPLFRSVPLAKFSKLQSFFLFRLNIIIELAFIDFSMDGEKLSYCFIVCQ